MICFKNKQILYNDESKRLTNVILQRVTFKRFRLVFCYVSKFQAC